MYILQIPWCSKSSFCRRDWIKCSRYKPTSFSFSSSSATAAAEAVPPFLQVGTFSAPPPFESGTVERDRGGKWTYCTKHTSKTFCSSPGFAAWGLINMCCATQLPIKIHDRNSPDTTGPFPFPFFAFPLSCTISVSGSGVPVASAELMWFLRAAVATVAVAIEAPPEAASGKRHPQRPNTLLVYLRRRSEKVFSLMSICRTQSCKEDQNRPDKKKN